MIAEQSRLGKALYRGQQIVHNYLNESKTFEAESQRLESSITLFGKTFKDLNKQLMGQNEIAYKMVSTKLKSTSFTKRYTIVFSRNVKRLMSKLV